MYQQQHLEHVEAGLAASRKPTLAPTHGTARGNLKLLSTVVLMALQDGQVGATLQSVMVRLVHGAVKRRRSYPGLLVIIESIRLSTSILSNLQYATSSFMKSREICKRRSEVELQQLNCIVKATNNSVLAAVTYCTTMSLCLVAELSI